MSTPRPSSPDVKRPRPGLALSVAANWLWYAVVIISGFLLPRLVDQSQGQAMLGVWDFGWSLVIYVSMLAMGISSAVNRYVARCLASDDFGGLNESVNTSLAILLLCGVAGVALGVLFAWVTPWMLQEHDPASARAGVWVVLLLCMGAAVQLPGGVFNGIITGCERFDVLNAIRIARDLIVLAGGAALLLVGYGVIALAACVMVAEVLGELAKAVAARRLCPQMRVSPRSFTRRSARDVLSFGGKTVLQSAARGGVYHGTGLLVAAFLGPASLAVFARQRALVMHALRFVKQYAQVFVPRSSALDAAGDTDALRRMLAESTMYGLYIMLPITLVLVIMGGPLMHVWMGPGYRAEAVMAILAVGHLLSVSQLGVYSLLMGMNRHGHAAWLDLAALIVTLAAGAALLATGGGLVEAALVMTIPTTISGGLIQPWLACRHIGVRVREYVAQSARGPVAAALPLALWLVVCRFWLADRPTEAVLMGVGGGGVLTALIYMNWVLPAHLRRRMLAPLRKLGRSSTSMATAQVASE